VKKLLVFILLLVGLFLASFIQWNSTDEPNPPPLVKAARSQIGKTLFYDASYTKLEYPNGDVPLYKGVCTDVVVRALRKSHKLDLQKYMHEDMLGHFGNYPQRWGAKKPDKNIDHRRVPNIRRYFERQGYALPVTSNQKDYQAGDIVTCTFGDNKTHIMIVSSRKSRMGRPYVIHNEGLGTRENDKLFAYTLTGHYRIKNAKTDQ
jgi:uncharacterized protein YijF (DUF1287 family)